MPAWYAVMMTHSLSDVFPGWDVADLGGSWIAHLLDIVSTALRDYLASL